MASSRKAVIFDLYGTLVDAVIDEESTGFWDRFSRELAAKNCSFTAAALKACYRELIQAEARHKEEGFLLDGVFGKLLARCGLTASADLVDAVGAAFRKESLVELKKKPYADELLSVLRRNSLAIGLLSNTEALVTRYDLKALRLQDSFDSVILSSSFGAKKPDPGIFREMLAALGVAGHEAIHVGDSFDTDIVGCVGAGIDGIYLTAADSRSISGIEDDFHGHVVLSPFSASEILAALRKLDVVLH